MSAFPILNQPAPQPNPEEREKSAIDPVCGMTVNRSTAAANSIFKGETYYFCAPGCKRRFDEAPLKYLNPEPKAQAQPGAEHVEFTCPMHPEVRQMGPGSCPKCGMALEPAGVALNDENPELASMTRRFWICAALTLPLLLDMLGMSSGGDAHMTGGWRPLLQLALATPVVLWGGWPFFVRGWQSVSSSRFREWNLNMFTLIALGTGVAYVASVYALLVPGVLSLYFEPAAVIVVLVLLGQVLELRARHQTGNALRALLELAPNTARLVEGAEERDVPIGDVQPGFLLRVRPGERIPVDGAVVEGSGTVDESTLTGEPIPVEKLPDSAVSAGTLNTAGSFIMRAERVGAETLLSRIVQMVADAQRTRAPIQRLADRVSAWFVPAVLAVSILSGAAWWFFGPEPKLQGALVNAVAVLIVACPCALGLATPMSIVAGTGRGAREGVLVRDAEALELLARVDTVVVDKTGTLTEGKPRLTQIFAAANIAENELLRLAASVETASEHPLAAALVAEARLRSLPLGRIDNFESLPGYGVRGNVDGRTVTAGNEALLQLSGIECPKAPGELPSIYTAIDERFAGSFSFDDSIKSSTRDALAMLRALDVSVVMATGDNERNANTVARALGIGSVRWGVLPGQKASFVEELKNSGRKVAMAGDGINDAPALSAADVGLAMGTGADIAVESAGVTLVSGDLRGVARAIRLGRATVRNIRQNLFFAFVYNLASVPVAAGILYPFFGIVLSPILASAAMTFSSVSVIVNSLRLRKITL